MKNTNITLHTTQKKEYVLTGILSLPLHLGERAWIYSYNQTLLQKSLSPGIPFITSHVYHLQSAFKFNNLYFMTIQHIEKLVIRENYF